MHRQLFNLFRIRKSTLLIAIAVVFLLSVFTNATYSAQNAGAVTTAASKGNDLDWQVQSWWYYNAMTQCMKNNGSWNISKSSDVSTGHWFDTIFTNNGSVVGWYMQNTVSMGDDARINCNENDDELPKAALTFWGLSGIDVMCGAGILVRDNGTDCTGGNGDFNWKSAGSDEAGPFSKYIRSQVFGGDTPSLTDAMKYVLYRQTLVNACMAPGAKSYDKDPGGANVYKVADIDTSTKPVSTVLHYYIGNQPETFEAWVSTNPDTQLTCKQLSAAIDDTAKSGLAAAAAAASDAGTKITPSGDINGDGTPDDATSCAIDGVGWIICPVVNFLAGIADGAFGFLANNFLKTDPKLLDTTSSTYTAWSYMRTFANVAFVIVFLIIIFSQLTSIGVSNYGVKKLLPRIIIAAILVNVSFFISQLAVDISNILGFSIKDVFNSISTSIDTSSVSNATASNPIGDDATGKGFAGIAGSVLAVAAVGIGGYAMLSTLIPVILAAVVALLLILFILVARQAIIVLLIVASPLAFVAFLLPNTEFLFKQWRKMLTSMLLLFPIVAVVFGASTLASNILSNSFDGSISGDTKNVFGQIISAAILVLPLFAVPILLKKSLDGIPVLGQMASKFAGRANGNVGKKLSESNKGSLVGRGLAYRKAGTEAYRTKKFASRVGKGGLAGMFARGVAVTPAGRAGQESLVKSATATSLKADAEEVEAAKGVMAMANISGADRHTLAKTGSVTITDQKTGKKQTLSGDIMQRAAIQEQFTKGSYGEQSELVEASARGRNLEKFSQTIANSVASNGLASKDPALAGKRIDEISQGNFDYQTAVTSAIGEGKYTPEAFATMNDDARSKAIAIAREKATNPNNPDPSYLEALQRAAIGIRASSEISGKLNNSALAVSQINSLLPPPTP